MKTKASVRVAAVAFAVVALGLAWFGLRETNTVNAKLAAMLRNQSLLNANIRQAEDRMAAVTQSGERVNPPPPKPTPRQLNNLAKALSQEKALLASNPRLRDLKAKSLRAGVNQHFGLFYRMAGLSAEQIERFEALVSGYEQASFDTSARPMSAGPAGIDMAVFDLLEQHNEQFQSDEKELLGSAAYLQLQEYIREEGALAGVRQAAWYTQPIEPYSADQVTQLVHILANASTSYQQGGTVRSIDWDQVLANAATVLSPAQMDGLQIPATAGVMDRLMKAYKNQQPAK